MNKIRDRMWHGDETVFTKQFSSSFHKILCITEETLQNLLSTLEEIW